MKWLQKRRFHVVALLFILGALITFSIRLTGVWDIVNYQMAFARYSPVDTTETVNLVNIDAGGERAKIISAFYGVDNSLPKSANFIICKGAGGKDGIPVVFSHQIDIKTLDPGDFKITNEKSEVKSVDCLTLAPADDLGELRTALLVGEFGNASKQPKHIDIVGNILSIDGKLNFRGASFEITPLEHGPSIVSAEIVPVLQWELSKVGSSLPWGDGTGCPDNTKQIIRVTWNGGISLAPQVTSYNEITQHYKVNVVAREMTKTKEIIPDKIADLKDGDNNHLLCLNTKERVLSVSFPEGMLVDPRNDRNVRTHFKIS